MFGQLGQVAGLCVLEHQFQQGHPAVFHDFIVIDGANIDEGKITGIQFSRCFRAGKQLRPVQRVGPGAATTVGKQQRNNQRQLLMTGIQVFLHGGNGVPHESERHMPVGTALVLNERINVSLTLGGLQGVQHVGKIGSQVFLNKGA